MTSEITGNLKAQCDALTGGVGFVDVCDRTRIELTGRDRATFLHNLCTNEIKQLTPGAGCEAFFANVQGKVLGHAIILCRAESLLVETVAGQATSLLAQLDKYLIREDVQLHDRTQTLAELLLSGPGAAEFLASVTGLQPPEMMLQHVDATIAEQPVTLARVPITGDHCFLVLCPAAVAEQISRQLTESGALGCGREALDVCRIESGWPDYGRDITDKNLPQEIARDRQAISFCKGCYLGQETVARIDALGHVNQRLVGLKCSTAAPLTAGTALSAGGRTVGHVTSAACSPRLDRTIALGYVRREFYAAGTTLTFPGGTADVAEPPF